MHDETDETIIRIGAALRPLPEVDPGQKARVLVAVAAERERARERRILVARAWRLGGGAALVAAAGLVAAVWLRTPRRVTAVAPSARTVSAPAAGASDSAAVGARLAADAKMAGYRSVQVVLRVPAARHVSVVGDFNAWDADADAMSRDPVTGLWSHTLALRPGRHVYAFVVDDSVWMRDPRSPEAVDEDFGRPGSVLLVGQP
ncbi:MAG: isoamylase early set domain-containing protein [Gemmatimonadaceae bacterium]